MGWQRLCVREKILKGLPVCLLLFTSTPAPAQSPAPAPFFPIVLVPLLSQLKRFNFDCIRFVVARFFSLSLCLLCSPFRFCFRRCLHNSLTNSQACSGQRRGKKEGVRSLSPGPLFAASFWQFYAAKGLAISWCDRK